MIYDLAMAILRFPFPISYTRMFFAVIEFLTTKVRPLELFISRHFVISSLEVAMHIGLEYNLEQTLEIAHGMCKRIVVSYITSE